MAALAFLWAHLTPRLGLGGAACPGLKQLFPSLRGGLEVPPLPCWASIQAWVMAG